MGRRALPDWLRKAVSRVLSWIPERLLVVALPSNLGFKKSQVPQPSIAPDAPTRLYVGPANSAGQGWQWSRAVERNNPAVGAVAMTAVLEDAFRFPIDYSVPLGVYRWSKSWQTRQAKAVEQGFTHVIVESGKRLFGDVLPGSVFAEATRLQAHGVNVALLFHGSDIRLPSRHVRLEQWSPFRDNLWALTPTLEVVAARNARLAELLGVPVFVSTPDLLIDLPDATWLPVVVEPEAWVGKIAPFTRGAIPRVAHAPSKAVVKGSDIVDPLLTRLHEEGILSYERIAGVPADEMPAIYTGVDIVLDQFRIGNYGVAACEAMAAGRVVVSHVSDQVREFVRSTTGLTLPIVEANGDNLEKVLREIIDSPGAWQDRSAEGITFVEEVHDGRRSATVLRQFIESEHRAC